MESGGRVGGWHMVRAGRGFCFIAKRDFVVCTLCSQRS